MGGGMPLKKLFDVSQRRSAGFMDKEVHTAGLFDVQQDAFEAPCAGESEAVVSEVSFLVPVCHETYRIDNPTLTQVDLFQSRSTVFALVLPSGVSGFSDNAVAYGDACRLANVVNVVKDSLDRSLFGFEQMPGRGPSSRGTEGKPIRKKTLCLALLLLIHVCCLSPCRHLSPQSLTSLLRCVRLM